MEEKITVSAEISRSDVALAFAVLGEELTQELWEKIKAAPSVIDFSKIEDKSERMQVKLGLTALLMQNFSD